MANSQLKNKQARKVLLKTWQRRTRHWPAPNPVSWWIRCQPNDGTRRPAPQIFSPGAARRGVRPDGLWVCFGDGGTWCDAIVVDPRVLSIFRAAYRRAVTSRNEMGCYDADELAGRDHLGLLPELRKMPLVASHQVVGTGSIGDTPEICRRRGPSRPGALALG